LLRARVADAWHTAQIIRGGTRQPLEAADRAEHRVGELERAGPRIAVPEDDREQLVVAKAAGADALELLARPIVRRDHLHLVFLPCAILFVVRRLLAIVILLLFTAGCSEPPQKEIDQAQGAVDAARTAGADTYAAMEFSAAVASLDKARAAVEQRDYRQALNYAIDSRQRANDAARQAAEAKGRAKHDIEAQYGEVATRANRLQAVLRTAETGGATAKALSPGQAALRDARASLQKASAAISAGNYAAAGQVLTEVRGKIDAAITEVQNIPPRPARKRGR
jgi:hypothetical protein